MKIFFFMAYVTLLFAMGFHPHAALASGLDAEPYIETTAKPGSFPLVNGNDAASIYIGNSDWPGVLRAANDLQSDIAAVTNHKPSLTHDLKSVGTNVIIVGTIGKSPLIDQLVQAGKIDTAKLAGKWESFFIQVVPNPLPGISTALVIVGSDKRGTIFGIYDLSEQIGVSPWHWWSDVPIPHKDAVFVKAGKFAQGEPSVKYRGIFLNDESPDLSNWVHANYGDVPNLNSVANYNSQFYARIFELLLRFKGNYLWPAMWNNAFNEDDSKNAKLADEYGIVMGTSHQEPMLRAQKEWDRRHREHWNYYTDAATLQDFWREGIKRNKDFESIITLGLRGANDTPMIPGGNVPQSMALLKDIIAAQRKIITEEINPDATKVPQLWCPYKEVLDYYNAGLRVPDDVTLLWTDDNWGNIRRLPTPDERNRSGGAGVYYHFDYVGGPRNYKWINTNPIPKIWEQMSLAKQYGADRIWIVNVGHFKGLEFPIEFFLRHAWNTNQWTQDNLGDYTRLWAEREFGAQYAADIADIISKYTKFNGRRKPELLDPTTYSQTNYQEADRVAADWVALVAKAEAIHAKLPENERDAFYELVLFPAKASAQVNELYIAAGKNAFYAQQKRAATNDLAAQVQTLFKADADLTDEFNHKLAGGKWNHFMDQVHIGYTNWQDPPRNVMPRIVTVQLPVAAAMGVIQDVDKTWPVLSKAPMLGLFDAFEQQRRYIDVYNRGQTAFDYTASADEPWIVLSNTTGKVEKESRIWVSVDWSKAPKAQATGTLRIARGNEEHVNLSVHVLNPANVTRETLEGFVETGNYVSMEAEHYTRMVAVGGAHWQKIDDYGRTLSAMTIMPMTALSAAPPAAPCLEYKIYFFDTGPMKVRSFVAPSLNFIPGRGLRYAVSFDDETPQVVAIVPPNFNAQNGNRDWEASVRDNCRVVESQHTLASAGYHTLKIWMVDPGVVLEKIVVDLGGAQPSYLGPPESYHHSLAK